MSHKQDKNKITADKTKVVNISYPEIPELEVYGILGKGGSGIVYKGRQPFLKRDVAIKVLNVEDGSVNDSFVGRFHREAQILADLIHPNIVSCFQAGMTNDTSDYPVSPYLVMEFIEGPSLLGWINEVKVVDQYIALGIIEKIANALDYAFRKTIIHRDIKAENILLKPLDSHSDSNFFESEFDYVPKLADLGIARSTQVDTEENLTLMGTMIGTPSSMAPEQFNNPDNIDFKVDIYGLGCVLFHMVTGKKPYAGLNLSEMVIQKHAPEPLDPRDINPKLNNDLAELILSMMSVHKEDRPSYDDLMRRCRIISLTLNDNRKQPRNTPAQKNNQRRWAVAVIIFFVALGGYSFWQKSTVTENVKTSPDKALSTPAAAIKKTSKETQKNVLHIQYVDNPEGTLVPGEAFHIQLNTMNDAHVYCYFENQKTEVIRFFPNRFNSDSLILKSNTLILPGDLPFDMNANENGISERIACISTPQNVLDSVSPKVIGVDFDTLPVNSLEEVKALYLKMNDIDVTDIMFNIKVVSNDIPPVKDEL